MITAKELANLLAQPYANAYAAGFLTRVAEHDELFAKHLGHLVEGLREQAEEQAEELAKASPASELDRGGR